MTKTKLPQKQVLQSKTPKVYKNKKLNNANFGDFTHNDYQVFLHLISKIGRVDESGKYLQSEELSKECTLSAKEFNRIFNTDISYCYKLLHKACEKLVKVSITVERPEIFETWYISICSMAKYNNKQGTITVRFTDEIMPYLTQVKQKFILYNLKEISNFGSFYTTRLYELVQEFKETGWLLKSVNQLREIFTVGNTFKRYGDFKKYTFAHACQEINDNYDIDLRFEEIKEGRKIVALQFFFKKTAIHKVVNQKTGIASNVYTKPKSRTVLLNNQKSSKVLESQLVSKQVQSLKDTLDSLLTKIK